MTFYIITLENMHINDKGKDKFLNIYATFVNLYYLLVTSK